MDVEDSKVSITGTVGYESAGREHRAGGFVVSGFVVQERARLTTSSRSERNLEIEIRGISALPDLIASLALEKPDQDDEEAQEDFLERMKTRDNIAKAFEEAAFRIRQAPRE
ncbi:hypothetical protein [Ensifer adhaerens]|uniref:hypothetical protein n=1 Tax=Ensifer adhaerens TaxID=106592 RepID=UPI001C4DE2E4|nr:hypothetical protein [Ensifer adhaerens]MBW0365862.1 hypothetical protein [Ensifer adhaerens]UCM20233.1 hypothetical protein LDL63_01105 [Ensifer adhaerens]